MTEEEQKKQKNRSQILLALAILIGGLTQKQISEISTFADVPKDVQKKIEEEYEKRNLDFAASKPDLTNIDIQKEMASQSSSKYWKILNPGDSRTCKSCQRWIGKILSDSDPRFPAIDDWIEDGGLHINCRCSLHDYTDMKRIEANANDYLQRKAERLAYHEAPIKKIAFL